MHAVSKIEEYKANTEDMTVEEMRAYYDKIGHDQLEGLDEAGQQSMFDRFLVSTSLSSRVIRKGAPWPLSSSTTLKLRVLAQFNMTKQPFEWRSERPKLILHPVQHHLCDACILDQLPFFA